MGIVFKKARVLRSSTETTPTSNIPGIGDYTGELTDTVIISEYYVKIANLSGLKMGDGGEGLYLSNETKAYGTMTSNIKKKDIIEIIETKQKYQITSDPVPGFVYLVMTVKEV